MNGVSIKTKRNLFSCSVLAALALTGGRAFGAAPPDAALPFVSPIFGDNMVLQRGKPNAIRGWSQPGATMLVEIGDNSATATAGAVGRWQTRFEPPPSNNPRKETSPGRI